MRAHWAVVAGLLGWAWGAGAQTPAAPAPPPTIRNSTTVPGAPVHAADDRGTAGELPLNTPHEEPGADITPPSSPVAPGSHASYLKPGTTLTLRMVSAASSGQQRNGDTVRATLQEPVHTLAGALLPAGTPVELTVLSSAAAGTMQSYGVLTLELLRVGGVGVYSNVLDFDGQEGYKILPDSAPEKGTEATVNVGTTLRFQVQGAGNNPDPLERPGGGGGRQGNSAAATGSAAQGQAGAPGASAQPGSVQSAPQATTPH